MRPLAAALALAAAASGNAWACLALGIGAWAVLWRAVEKKETLWTALAAGASAAAIDFTLAGSKLLFYRQVELAGLEWAVGPSVARAALMAVALEVYLYARRSRSALTAGASAGLAGFCFGLWIDALGVHGSLWGGLWVWNATLVPDLTALGAPLFVPFAWGTTFAFSGFYFHMTARIKRRLPSGARPIGSGLMCGAALGGFLLFYLLLFLIIAGRSV